MIKLDLDCNCGCNGRIREHDDRNNRREGGGEKRFYALNITLPVVKCVDHYCRVKRASIVHRQRILNSNILGFRHENLSAVNSQTLYKKTNLVKTCIKNLDRCHKVRVYSNKQLAKIAQILQIPLYDTQEVATVQFAKFC